MTYFRRRTVARGLVASAYNPFDIEGSFLLPTGGYQSLASLGDSLESVWRLGNVERQHGDEAHHNEDDIWGGVRGTVAPVVKVAEAVGGILKILPLHIQLLGKERETILVPSWYRLHLSAPEPSISANKYLLTKQENEVPVPVFF